MTIFYSEDLKYLARVLEGLSLIYPESNDGSLVAQVEVRRRSPRGMDPSQAQSVGKVRYRGDSTWDFSTHDVMHDLIDVPVISEAQIFKLPLSLDAKAYIKKLKEDIDYIGTTMGIYVHVNLLDEFNNGRQVGFINNLSGVAQYYTTA